MYKSKIDRVESLKPHFQKLVEEISNDLDPKYGIEINRHLNIFFAKTLEILQVQHDLLLLRNK